MSIAKSPVSSDKPNQLIQFTLAFIAVLIGVEVYWLQLMRESMEEIGDIFYGSWSVLLLPAMVYPLYVAFGAQVRNLYASQVNKTPFFVKVGTNSIQAFRLDDTTINIEVDGSFSRKNELIADVEPLVAALSQAFRYGYRGTYTAPAPYVLVSVSQDISPLQSSALKQSLLQAGAGHAVRIADNANVSEALSFFNANPYK